MDDHFNKLSPKEAELLALIAEECGEVVQAIGKTLRHGLESFSPLDKTEETNRSRVTRELGDLSAVVYLAIEAGMISDDDLRAARENKEHNVKRWLHHFQERKATDHG